MSQVLYRVSVCRWSAERYVLDGHAGHRLQGVVPGGGEVVAVTLHLDGLQPLGHRAEGAEVGRVLVQQGADGSEGGEETS